MRTVISMRGCAGWFESSSGAHVRRYVSDDAAHFYRCRFHGNDSFRLLYHFWIYCREGVVQNALFVLWVWNVFFCIFFFFFVFLFNGTSKFMFYLLSLVILSTTDRPKCLQIPFYKTLLTSQKWEKMSTTGRLKCLQNPFWRRKKKLLNSTKLHTRFLICSLILLINSEKQSSWQAVISMSPITKKPWTSFNHSHHPDKVSRHKLMILFLFF